MRRRDAYLLIGILVAVAGVFVLIAAIQVSANPKLLVPVFGGFLFVVAFLLWEVVMKPPSARREAWENLRGKPKQAAAGVPLRAFKVPKAPGSRSSGEEELLDAGSEESRVPSDLAQDK